MIDGQEYFTAITTDVIALLDSYQELYGQFGNTMAAVLIQHRKNFDLAMVRNDYNRLAALCMAIDLFSIAREGVTGGVIDAAS